MENPFTEFVQQCFYEASKDSNMYLKPLTVRLPLDLIAQIDFLASELKITRQALMEEFVREGVRGVLAAYVSRCSTGAEKLYEDFIRVGDEALASQVQEPNND